MAERVLIPLDQYNRERRAEYKGLYDAKTSGVACPKCGEELWIENPQMVLTSFPPQQKVRCRACKWLGNIVA